MQKSDFSRENRAKMCDIQSLPYPEAISEEIIATMKNILSRTRYRLSSASNFGGDTLYYRLMFYNKLAVMWIITAFGILEINGLFAPQQIHYMLIFLHGHSCTDYGFP